MAPFVKQFWSENRKDGILKHVQGSSNHTKRKRYKRILKRIIRGLVPVSNVLFGVGLYRLGWCVESMCDYLCTSLDYEGNEDSTLCLEEIYQTLISHPRLACAIPGELPLQSFIHSDDGKNGARYYASLLWNWRFHTEAYKQNQHEVYLKKSVDLCINHMEYKDIQVIQTLLSAQYSQLFPGIDSFVDVLSVKMYLKTVVHHKGSNTLMAVIKAIHNWFLLMPILLELSRLTSWEFLNNNKVCLLDLDTLYGILLNATYKN